MMENTGNRITGAARRLAGRRSGGGPVTGRAVAARIIGALALTLLFGSSALGQFMIQPMIVTVQAPPGKRTPVQVIIENNVRDAVMHVDLRIADVTQDENGNWQAIDPDVYAKRTKNADGTEWVTVIDENGAPLQLNVTNLKSCQSWLRLMDDVMQVAPMNRVPIHVFVDVPPGTRGYYCAALLAQAPLGVQEIEGVTSALSIEFLVPIIVEVQGRPERHKVDLINAGLELLRSERGQVATVVNVRVKNDGGTYSRIKAYARIWTKFGGRWRKVTDIDFSETSIIPGSEFSLRRDVGRPLPSGEYRVQGYLFVDGMRGAEVTQEFRFPGDPRARNVSVDAALDLDPRELVIETAPGQARTQALMIANASEDTIHVTARVDLPDHMFHTVHGNITGAQFNCGEWLTVTPAEFILAGGQRMGLRVMSQMPGGADNANYYAMIRLQARYPDGEPAGKTDCRVCVGNKTVGNKTVVQAFDPTIAELTPGRYAVTARFINTGDMHVQPACWGALTSATGSLVRQFSLYRDVLNESGILLPLESRVFTGVLSAGGLSPGLYRLTVAMSRAGERDSLIQKQVGLEVVATPTGTELHLTQLTSAPVPIKL
jgi:hypothetical protein